MIVPMVPYCPKGEGPPGYEGRSLGYAYDQCMRRLRPGDIGILQDHDVMHTTRYWYRLVELAVEENEGYGLISCMASRTACSWQKAGHPHDDSLMFHMEHGQARAEKHGSEVVDVTDQVADGSGLPAGYFQIIPKSVWGEIVVPMEGIPGTDWKIASRIQQAGYKIGVMPGLYVLHWCREVLGEGHP